MTTPTRPVDAAEIETDWGQQVHDFTFAPSGCSVSGAINNTVGSTYSKMALANVFDDPGGFLDAANNQVVIPTDRGGLYSANLQMNTVNGSAGSGFGTRTQLRLNGAAIAVGFEQNNAGTNVPFSCSWVGILAAGDILTVYSQKVGGGTAPDVQVIDLLLYRVGAELGA